MMSTDGFLMALHVVTSGLNEMDLGSDEADIAIISWVIIDVSNRRVVDVQSRTIRPRGSKDIADPPAPSMATLMQFNLTEESLKAASSLESVLEEIDQSVANRIQSGKSLHLVTDGPLHLRQVMHPKCSQHNVPLSHLFYSYFDIRNEVTSCFPHLTTPTSIQDMVTRLSLDADSSADPATQRVMDMSNIIIHLLDRGHSFKSPDKINERLEIGVCNQHEVVNKETVVRTRGLPWQSSDQDIATFFRGLNIVRGGVALCLGPQGRRNGEALVRFENRQHRDLAIRRHRHHMGNRYIEVYAANGEDFVNIASGTNNEAHEFLSKGGQVIIRMRGLPYDCTAQQVTQFFANDKLNPPCEVMSGENGVLFVKKIDGRSTGDAFVLFASEEEATKGLSKHRQLIGTRYIELFRSSTAEVQQVLNRTMDKQQQQQQQQQQQPQPHLLTNHHHHHLSLMHQQHNHPLMQSLAPPLPLPLSLPNQQPNVNQQVQGQVSPGSNHQPSPQSQHNGSSPPGVMMPQLSPPLLPPLPLMPSSGTRKDCIRLRGLPYEAQVEQILEFLADQAKNIVFQGVHMVYNSQGQPSGEAFIQMDCENSANLASATKHHKYMSFGKKLRYIEVFQCSIDDMNLVLTGGVPLQRPLLSSGPGNHHLLHSSTFHGAGPFPLHGFPPVMPPAMAAAAAAAAQAVAMSAANGARLPGSYYLPIYWPYPSPPVSPTTYYTP